MRRHHRQSKRIHVILLINISEQDKQHTLYPCTTLGLGDATIFVTGMENQGSLWSRGLS